MADVRVKDVVYDVCEDADTVRKLVLAAFMQDGEDGEIIELTHYDEWRREENSKAATDGISNDYFTAYSRGGDYVMSIPASFVGNDMVHIPKRRLFIDASSVSAISDSIRDLVSEGESADV